MYRTDHAALLLAQLARGPRRANELAAALGVSRPTVTRALVRLLQSQQALTLGAARATSYARIEVPLGMDSGQWPVHRIDVDGRVHPLGTLFSLAAGQYWCDIDRRLHDGLPYYLQDQRPAGFLGRNVPRRHPQLQLPQRVADWTDAHYLRYLTQEGWDAVGDLVVGEAALDRFLASTPLPVSASERSVRYAALAAQVTAGELPGSSAQGEQPKFAAIVADDGLRHCLVKFSPPRATALGQRWSDLLVAEHLAHRLLSADGIAASESELLLTDERAYLEVRRFDRVGPRGRRGVTSLAAIDVALYGRLDAWPAAAQRLERAGRLGGTDLRTIRLLGAFAEMIANTDRHFGNLSFFDDYSGRFVLAPVYDMLPMLFAPQDDQLVERDFAPPPPTAATVSVHDEALELARRYWRALCEDQRISSGFRQICVECGARLKA
jgi:hypothetical protein